MTSGTIVYYVIPSVMPVIFIVIGYVAGTRAEKRHFRSIEARERALAGRVIVTIDEEYPLIDTPRGTAQLVSGSTVVSIDYFKSFLARLINLVGGKIVTYETLLERGRREALLRMRESSGDAPLIINVRIQTAPLGGTIRAVEVFAYGTAFESPGAAPLRQ